MQEKERPQVILRAERCFQRNLEKRGFWRKLALGIKEPGKSGNGLVKRFYARIRIGGNEPLNFDNLTL